MNENRVLEVLAPYRKALTALLVAPLLTLVAVVPDGITAMEWALVALNAVAPAGTVYAVPNKTLPGAVHTPAPDAT